MSAEHRPASGSVAVLPDLDALMDAAAERIVSVCELTLRERPRFRWALSGGSTPRGLYTRLASEPFRSRIAWSRVDFFWSDERCVPPDHPDSNYRMARESLLDVIRPDPKHVHRMQGELAPVQSAAAYEARLRALFTQDDSPTGLPEQPGSGRAPDATHWLLPRRAGSQGGFDLVLLGMGADGHTASLFPGSPALGETRRWVAVTQEPGSGSTRLSLTLRAINAARNVLFLVAGVDKAERLQQVLEDDSAAVTALPARQVRPAQGRLEWLVDAAAAARLATRR